MKRPKYTFNTKNPKNISKTYRYQKELLSKVYINGQSNDQLREYIKRGLQLFEEETSRIIYQFTHKKDETGKFIENSRKPNLAFSTAFTKDIHDEIIKLQGRDVYEMDQSELRHIAGRIREIAQYTYYTRTGVEQHQSRFNLFLQEHGEIYGLTELEAKNFGRLWEALYTNIKSGYQKTFYESQLREIYEILESDNKVAVLKKDLSDEDIQQLANSIMGVEDTEDVDPNIFDMVGNRND